MQDAVLPARFRFRPRLWVRLAPGAHARRVLHSAGGGGRRLDRPQGDLDSADRLFPVGRGVALAPLRQEKVGWRGPYGPLYASVAAAARTTYLTKYALPVGCCHERAFQPVWPRLIVRSIEIVWRSERRKVGADHTGRYTRPRQPPPSRKFEARI